MKLKDYFFLIAALTGWGLYALDDTLSALIYEIVKDGISASIFLQLATFSSVTFLAVKYERHISIFIKKIEQIQMDNNNSKEKIKDEFELKIKNNQSEVSIKIQEIRKYLNETLTSFLSKIKQLNSDHKQIEEQSTSVARKQEKYKQESESLKELFIRLIIQIVERK